MRALLEHIREFFHLPGTIGAFRALSDGGIHETYQITMHTGKNYIFQHMNTHVFTKPEAVMQNISQVTGWLRTHYPDMQTLYFYQAGGHYLCDGWRVMDFIDGFSLKTCSDLHQIHRSGKAFGQFQSRISGFDGELVQTIPDFHNTRTYFEKLLSFRTGLDEFRILAQWQEQACGVFDAYRHLPRRVTHNDMKCSNLLFDRETNRSAAVIDLDTVMSGMAAYDFGDAVRSIASKTSSGNSDFSKIGLDMNKFRAFASGWLSEMHYAPEEKQLLIPAVFAVTAELAARYLTDYLQGNIYFRTSYPEQNLIRAGNQIRLAKDILNHKSEMEEIIYEIPE